MGKGKKTKTAVYHPPRSGMPYFGCDGSPDGITATACESKESSHPRLEEDDGGFD